MRHLWANLAGTFVNQQRHYTHHRGRWDYKHESRWEFISKSGTEVWHTGHGADCTPSSAGWTRLSSNSIISIVLGRFNCDWEDEGTLLFSPPRTRPWPLKGMKVFDVVGLETTPPWVGLAIWLDSDWSRWFSSAGDLIVIVELPLFFTALLVPTILLPFTVLDFVPLLPWGRTSWEGNVLSIDLLLDGGLVAKKPRMSRVPGGASIFGFLDSVKDGKFVDAQLH